MEGKSEYFRTLFLYFCSECASTESWKCIRTLELDNGEGDSKSKKAKKKKKLKQQLDVAPVSDEWDVSTSWGDDDWGVEIDSNSWDNNAMDDVEALLKMRDLSLEEKNTGEKKVSKSNTVVEEKVEDPEKVDITFPGWWLAIDDEPKTQKRKDLDEDNDKDYNYNESASTLDGEWKGEKYERCTIVTKSFSKFLKYINRAPQQVIRYCYSGEPLWVTDRDIPVAPSCDCGSPRVFELQLMPFGLNWIKDNIVISSKGKIQMIGYGSIYIFSCSSCCTTNNISKEIVLIQATEDSIGALRK